MTPSHEPPSGPTPSGPTAAARPAPDPDPDRPREAAPRDGAYLVMFSVHGLIRGHDLELGRDADTGGQTKYVVELARALARRPEVAAVDLITRRIDDPDVDPAYDRELEDLGDGARIVRLRFGGGRYRRKEALWPHLDELVAESLRFFRAQGRTPDLVHGHYADAGDAARAVAARLGLPLVVTGHSLGRNKRQVLERAGVDPEAMERRYRLAHRIEVEERLLRDADLVIASTRHEVERGYELYDAAGDARFEVLPPGSTSTASTPTTATRTRASTRARRCGGRAPGCAARSAASSSGRRSR